MISPNKRLSGFTILIYIVTTCGYWWTRIHVLASSELRTTSRLVIVVGTQYIIGRHKRFRGGGVLWRVEGRRGRKESYSTGGKKTTENELNLLVAGQDSVRR